MTAILSAAAVQPTTARPATPHADSAGSSGSSDEFAGVLSGTLAAKAPGSHEHGPGRPGRHGAHTAATTRRSAQPAAPDPAAAGLISSGPSALGQAPTLPAVATTPALATLIASPALIAAPTLIASPALIAAPTLAASPAPTVPPAVAGSPALAASPALTMPPTGVAAAQPTTTQPTTTQPVGRPTTPRTTQSLAATSGVGTAPTVGQPHKAATKAPAPDVIGADATAAKPAAASTNYAAVASTVHPAHAVSTPIPTVAATQATATRPVTQPELTSTMNRLRLKGDGTHELSVQLHPLELGAVHVTAIIRDGEMTVTVACADESARQAVLAALPSLHHQLNGGQLNGGRLNAGWATIDLNPAANTSPAAGDQNQNQNQNQQPRDNRPGAEAMRHSPGSRPNGSESGRTPAVPAGATLRQNSRNVNLDRWM